MKQLQITSRITNRDENSLIAYLNKVSKLQPLSSENEAELARRIHQGDKVALEKLVSANLRFVVSVAKTYQDQGLALADLISEGNIGLVKAAETFDETRGFKFISHAVWYIRQSIMKALTECSRTIRLPHNQDTLLRNIRRTFDRLEQEMERPATVEEVAEELDLDIEMVNDILRANHRSTSLDAPLTDEDGGTLLDILPSVNSYSADLGLEYDSLRVELEDLMNSNLTQRDIYVLKQSFGIGCTERSNEEIGRELGLTRERVRQIGQHAILKLRKSYQSYRLQTYCR